MNSSLSEIKMLLHIMSTMKPYNRTQTLEFIDPIASFHEMKIDDSEIIMPEDDPLLLHYNIGNAQKNRIRFSDIVLIQDRDLFVRVYLRSGYMHNLSTFSSFRTYNHLYLDNLKPPGKLKTLWHKFCLFWTIT